MTEQKEEKKEKEKEEKEEKKEEKKKENCLGRDGRTDDIGGSIRDPRGPKKHKEKNKSHGCLPMYSL